MIGVTPAAEPANFNNTIRQRGLSAIDEMVGRPPRVKRPGPRRPKIASVETAIPSDKFPPFWRDAIDDMMHLYESRCAYLAMVIERTGNPTVDHMIPKSLDWNRVYEWENYRLCAAIVNSKKNNLQGIVDPFVAKAGWFELELTTCKVIRGSAAPTPHHVEIDDTLPLLNLRDCCLQRKTYIEYYNKGPGSKGIDLSYLEHRAPFIAAELRRQGQLLRGDI